MTPSTEKKCCEECRDYFPDTPSVILPCAKPDCPCHTAEKKCIHGVPGEDCQKCFLHISEKPVQYKTHEAPEKGASHVKMASPAEADTESIAPVVEEWAGKLMDEFCVMFERAGRVTDANDLVWVVKMEAFISKLLQDERSTTYGRSAAYNLGLSEGRKFERQRIEDAARGLIEKDDFKYLGMSGGKIYNDAIRAVLKIIRGEGTERA